MNLSSVRLQNFFFFFFVSILLMFVADFPFMNLVLFVYRFYFFFCSVRFYLLQFLFGITRKKKLFQFYRLLKSVFLFSITKKKKNLQFFFLVCIISV